MSLSLLYQTSLSCLPVRLDSDDSSQKNFGLFFPNDSPNSRQKYLFDNQWISDITERIQSRKITLFQIGLLTSKQKASTDCYHRRTFVRVILSAQQVQETSVNFNTEKVWREGLPSHQPTVRICENIRSSTEKPYLKPILMNFEVFISNRRTYFRQLCKVVKKLWRQGKLGQNFQLKCGVKQS